MKEQDYQRKITKYLESQGAYVVKVITASKKGVPDILACYKGVFLAIEVKTPTTRRNTSELQKYNLAKVKEAGGYSLVAVELEDTYATMVMIDVQHQLNEELTPTMEQLPNED